MSYKHHVEVADSIAKILETKGASDNLCDYLWKHVREMIEKADLTHPETIRLIYPVAAAIVEKHGGKLDLKLVENRLES